MSLKDWFGGPENSDTKEVKIPASELNKLKADAQEAVDQLDTLTKEKNQLSEQVENLKKEASDAKAALQSEKSEHEKTKNAFEAFKKESGETHTTVDHKEDTVGGSSKSSENNPIRSAEAKAREEGERIFNSKQSKTEK